MYEISCSAERNLPICCTHARLFPDRSLPWSIAIGTGSLGSDNGVVLAVLDEDIHVGVVVERAAKYPYPTAIHGEAVIPSTNCVKITVREFKVIPLRTTRILVDLARLPGGIEITIRELEIRPIPRDMQGQPRCRAYITPLSMEV